LFRSEPARRESSGPRTMARSRQRGARVHTGGAALAAIGLCLAAAWRSQQSIGHAAEAFGVLGRCGRNSVSIREVRRLAQAAGRSHGDVAASMSAKMPAPPADPLEWSVDDVRAADFMGSASYAGSLCRALEQGADGEEYQQRLSAMLGHGDGARGFFVTYLTDPALTRIADAPEGIAPVVASALRGADLEVVAPLAIMNLAMPTATALAHAAKGDEAAAARSALTARRGLRVLQLLASDAEAGAPVREQLRRAREAADETPGAGADGGEWHQFYKRWKYGDEQMAAVRSVLDDALGVSAR